MFGRFGSMIAPQTPLLVRIIICYLGLYIFLRLSVNFIGKNMASITAGPFRRHSYHLWYIIIAFSRDIEYSITRHNIRSREHWNKGKKEEIH